jgi:hypothetical protein
MEREVSFSSEEIFWPSSVPVDVGASEDEPESGGAVLAW